MNLTLFCCLVDSNTPFAVDLPSSLTVGHLKKAIKEEKPNDLKEIDTDKLSLFKVSIPDEDDLAQKLQDAVKASKPLRSTTELTEIFPDKPPKRTIHIAVRLPDDAPGIPKRPARTSVAGDILGRWRNKHIRLVIPSTLSDLQTLINTPLLENEKIPLSQIQFDDLLGTSPNERHDFLTLEEVNTLFRVSDTEHATLLETVFFHAAFTPPPPLDGTEDSYISFWDSNIRNVIQLLVPSGKAIRNSNKHTATRALRPDFGYLIDDRCPLRGEERGPENAKDPRVELSQKLDWDYGSVPYLFGYYCRARQLTHVAIYKPDQPNHKPKLQDFANVDLSTRKGRITNMRWLINLSPLLQELVNLMPQREAEYKPMKRDNCTVELTAQHVIKTYTCRDAVEKVEHLEKIYHNLQEKGVPNTDSLYYSSGEVIVLQPRGHLAKPRTEKELLEAVSCILQVLKVIHSASLFHRDIRWPNVIRRKDDSTQWFLIDWEDAQEAPTKALSHFASDSHSACIFRDGHGGEVDIWGVGNLITESGVIGLSHEVRQFGVWMKEKSPSAEEVWAKLEHYTGNCLTGTIES